MSSSDSDSEFSFHDSDDDFIEVEETRSSRSNRQTTSRSSRRRVSSSMSPDESPSPAKRQKRNNDEIVVIDSSSDDGDSDSDDMGLLQRLKNRSSTTNTSTSTSSRQTATTSSRRINTNIRPSRPTGGLKTTGLSSDENSYGESDDGEEKKQDDYRPKNTATLGNVKNTFIVKSTFSNQDCDDYLQSLQRNVEEREFNLDQIPQHQVISTGRTIKSLKAWSGIWPALREFLQNTVDHLSLLDGKTGRRRACLAMNAQKENSTVSTVSFTCQDKTVCKFIVQPDELIIEQQFTFPIASRSLDTGVIDTSKSNTSNCAGGFGDGFKTAAAALMCKGKDFHSLKWIFYAVQEKTKITWTFQGETKDAIATFAKSKALQVVIEKERMTTSEVQKLSSSDASAYVMRQVINVKNIGKEFINKAVPMFTVFWDLDESVLLSTDGRNRRGLGGDFIGPATVQPMIFQGKLGSIKPKSGIYVRGIYVRPSKIKDSIMCFYGNRLEVSGRDRNEVDDDELIKATRYVLHRCHLRYLQSLLQGLTEPSRGTSWLLQSPSFLNRILEEERDFILYDVLQYSKGCIFISNKTTNSKDPFIQWSSKFLADNDMPLVPIEKGVNKYLFQEIDEYSLAEKCVRLIKAKMKKESKKKSDGNMQTVFSQFLRFLGVGRSKVIFSRHVTIPFIHDGNIYIPESNLSKELLVRVLNVCLTRLEGVKNENYSSLLESILKSLDDGIIKSFTTNDAKKIIDRAKKIQQKSSKFLSNSTTTTKESVEVLDDSDEEDGSNQKNVKSNKFTADKHVENMFKNAKKCGIGGRGFEKDNAGPDDCIRSASELLPMNVDDSFGGGSILFDRDTSNEVKNKSFNKTRVKKIQKLRKQLNEATNVIQKAIPGISKHLDMIFHAYDGKNDEYEGFYDGERIVVNLFPFLSKFNSDRQAVLHFVTVLTHEYAHFTRPDAGHGPEWRDAHMKMLIEVMKTLED